MPLYEYRCAAGHTTEQYVARSSQATVFGSCRVCGGPAVRQFPLPNVPHYFSESNGRIIANLAPGVPIHSHGQHQRLMREKGLEPATQWHTSSMKQTDGLPPRSRPSHPWQRLQGT